MGKKDEGKPPTELEVKEPPEKVDLIKKQMEAEPVGEPGGPVEDSE